MAQGANVNVADKSGRRVIMGAAYNSHWKIVKVILWVLIDTKYYLWYFLFQRDELFVNKLGES